MANGGVAQAAVAGQPVAPALPAWQPEYEPAGPAWQPEYEPAGPTITATDGSVADQRYTRIALSDILETSAQKRKTKIFCTLGPACWSEEGLAGLLDAGMNVCRFNFSHGD
eukprot:SAG31_NODE_3503_length_4189_cov_1.900978_5_plen_110_part_01